MSALGDLVRDIGAAAGDEGKNTVESLVKNPELQKRLDLGLGDYDRTRTASSQALDQYIRDFLAGGKTASARSAQEQGVIDRFYNGDVERQLADLRRRQAGVADQALARSFDYMRRNQNASIVGGSGGGSSYDNRLRLGAGNDLALNSLLQRLAQERADTDYLTRSQLGLAGQRTGMADALAARGLVPATAMKGELGWNLDALRNLIGLDQANKFYGIKYEPSGSEMAGNIVGDVGNLAAAYFTGGASGMLGGMMGGGGGSQRQGLVNWMPSASTRPAMDQWGSPVNTSWGWGSPMNPYDYESGGSLVNYDMSGWNSPAMQQAFGPWG